MAVTASPISASAAAPCRSAATGKDEIARLNDHWDAALATGNSEEVAKLYAHDAVLLPAPSETLRVGRPEIRAYFEQFLKRHPDKASSRRLLSIGCNTASGIATLTYRITGTRKGTRLLVEVRSSTQYEYRDGAWLIVRQASLPSPYPTDA